MQRSAQRGSGPRPITVALDAMGGDNAPATIVRGALSAARDRDVDIILVGRGREIRSLLPAAQRNLRIHEASEAIAMDASPTAVRRMRDSSIMVGLGLLADGEADAFLSFGNTGAVMAGSLFSLGRIPGVARPALGALFRNGRGTTSLLLDVGANVEARPQYMCQFATMGRAYVERVLRHRNPSVGLLNVGEEALKGTSLHQETYRLLERQEANFVGNIEANRMVAGAADVIVSDGVHRQRRREVDRRRGRATVRRTEAQHPGEPGAHGRRLVDARRVPGAARALGLRQGRLGAAVRDRWRGSGRPWPSERRGRDQRHPVGSQRG